MGWGWVRVGLDLSDPNPTLTLTYYKGLRSGSYRTGILELYSIEKRTTGS
jgi:hypothetical protein